MQQVIKDKHGNKVGYVERTSNSTRIKEKYGHVERIISHSSSSGRRDKRGGL